MKNTDKQHNQNKGGFDRPLTRHDNWKNHRRHTLLKLLRFS